MKAVRLVAVLIGVIAVPLHAELHAPVRMGCGIMTFDPVPGWGLDKKGLSQIWPTRGGVALDVRIMKLVRVR